MKASIKRRRPGLIILLSLVIIMSFGFVTLKDKEFDIVKNLEIFYSLFNEVNRLYVDETNPDKLIKSAIDGMLNSLDPYTTYIPEEDMADFTFMTTGEYGGIGALIRKGGNYAIVSEPYEGFPAQQTGLRAGDTIYTIDGTSTRGKEISAVSDMLKGTPNTSLRLQIKRIGTPGILEKTLTRRVISIPNVPYYGMLTGKTGYIRLTGFTKDAGSETGNAVKALKAQGATSLILDLRGNPGGLLNEAVNVANLFVSKGKEVVRTKGKVKQWDNVHATTALPVDTLIPLVVLVNRGSASAAEIVAGALQDLDRALIVGQRTFGKGLVQTTRPLSYNAQLKVTTAKYYIPSGRCIQAVDYTHRNEDGSVGTIPDSLIREFKTLHGRKVYDGGGISPDVATEAQRISNIAVSLYGKNLISDFATRWVVDHPAASAVEKLKPSDEMYTAFVGFLKDKNYDYTTESDDKLDELIKAARLEKYYDGASSEFEALKGKLAHDKEKDLQTFRNEINQLLYEELASRYFYQKGRISVSLGDDPDLDKAMDVLKDPTGFTMHLNTSPAHVLSSGVME